MQQDRFLYHPTYHINYIYYQVRTQAPSFEPCPIDPISSGSASPTQGACAGDLYNVQSGDSCESVSTSQGLSTISLLAANPTLACSSFPESGSLCIPSSAKCKVYTVQDGDTCASVADANSLTWTQVVTWNPALGKACSNIGTSVGQQICVSNPGGTWVNPSPDPVTPTSTFV